jgi:ankyrin repeat protein
LLNKLIVNYLKKNIFKNKMESPFKQFDKVALLALASKMDDKTLLNFCNTDKYFNSKICKDDSFWAHRLNEKYPLLIEFKKGTWKQFYLRMSYYIAKLEENFGIPYIPTKSYNPEDFYKEFKNKKYIFNTAMTYAAKGGNMDIVKLMIEKGATAFNSSMMYAAEEGHMEIVKLMIEKGATYFNAGLIIVAGRGYMEIVKLMIEKGATNFNSGMNYAAGGGHMEIVKLMIEKGATDFNWAISYAAEGGHIEIVKFLIEKGATNFNIAMTTAAEEGYMKIVKLLIEKGADNFNNAIESAARGGHMEIVNYLKQFVK